MATDYRARLKVPAETIDAGDREMRLFSRCGTLLAVGFDRIVIGGRGPYVEFCDHHLELGKFKHIRVGAYYVEFRSRDEANVKLYKQLAQVPYADYKVGKTYISPFDLFNEDGVSLIDPLRKKD
jgi:hypothetical protein